MREGGGLFSVTATFHRQSGKQDNINTFTEIQIIMLHLFSITLRNPFEREVWGCLLAKVWEVETVSTPGELEELKRWNSQLKKAFKMQLFLE